MDKEFFIYGLGKNYALCITKLGWIIYLRYVIFTIIGDNNFQHLNSKNKVLNFFQKYFPDTYISILDLLGFLARPIEKLGSIYCNKWNYKRCCLQFLRILLILLCHFWSGHECILARLYCVKIFCR